MAQPVVSTPTLVMFRLGFFLIIVLPVPVEKSAGPLMLTVAPSSVSVSLAVTLALVLRVPETLTLVALTLALVLRMPATFTVVGLIALAIVSTLGELRYNEALLVFFPGDLALPFLSPARRQGYARVRVAIMMMASLLMAVGLLVQPLWVPILLAFSPLFIVALPESRLPRWGSAPSV